METKSRVMFFGTPSISACALQSLIDLNQNIVGVVTQPDKNKDRKGKVIFSEVKKLSLDNNLKLFQPKNVNDIINEIKNLNPDIIITCAFGQFIKEEILSIPKYKCVNLHASLLPKLRGGAPIHWSIINGHNETGITLMYMEKSMDSGNIIFSDKVKIEYKDTLDTLLLKLSTLAYDMIKKYFYKLLDNNIQTISQNIDDVTFGYNISKEQTYINFNDKCNNIYNFIRGLNSKPVSKILFKDISYKIFNSEETKIKSSSEPGTIISISKDGIEVATKDFNILILDIQIPSKKVMLIKELINGICPFKVMDIFKSTYE